MIEDFASRAWAEHHKSFARNIADAAHAVGVAIERLSARQYDAPWKRSAAKDGAHCA
ncbi:MAG: hypothetical protein H0X36_05760 [Sphingomonadaceae bacterium]|nr:hypothetical protein [Sphingomonadaceae bacterium]